MNDLQFTSLPLRLAETSPWLLLLFKLTALLAVGWIGHAVLARRNPRYRLFWWRGMLCAVVVIAGLSVGSLGYSIDVEQQTQAEVVTQSPTQLPVRTEIDSQRSAVPMRSVVHRAKADVEPVKQPKAGQVQVARLDVPRQSASAPRPTRQTAKPIQASSALPAFAVGQSAVEPVNRWSIDWSTALLTLWLTGVGLMLLRLSIAAWRVRRFAHQATPAGHRLQAECDRVANSLNITREIAVLRHDRLTSPVLLGALRPRILLPAWMADGDSHEDLPAVLAHELSHVRSCDLLWQMLLHVAATLLWFHPLTWSLRRVHLADCERKADVDSAAFLGETGPYIRTLARVALRVSSMVPNGGLAMARTSDVTRRLAFLKDAVISGPLRWRTLAAAGFIGMLLALGLGGLRFAIAEPALVEQPAKTKPKAQDVARTRTMTVRVLDVKGKPITKARVQVRIGNDRKIHPVDKNGSVTLNLPAKQPRLFYVWVKSSEHAWSRATWWNRKDRLTEPIPRQITFKLETGTRLGGVVVDEDGKPVQGAEIFISVNGREATPEDPRSQWVYGYTVKTDKTGRWKTAPIIPANPRRISLRYSHPDFIDQYGSRAVLGPRWKELRKFTYEIALKRGHNIEGTVTGPDGKPVVGAVLALGHSPWGAAGRHPKPKTDKNGVYRFKNVPKGQTTITVVSKHHAPDLKEINVSDELDSVNFRLKKGKTLSLRVVNKAGRPVAGARVIPDTWRGHRSLMGLYDGMIPKLTDKNGRLVWKHAPEDEILFDILPKDYMAERDQALKPAGKEHVITVVDQLRVSGTVIDAETKKPIPGFEIVQGYHLSRDAEVYWDRYRIVHGRDGKFKFAADLSKPKVYFRAQAKGYKAEVSRAIKRDAGKVVVNFSLTRAAGPAGIVMHKGKPVGGAKIYMCLPKQGVYVRNGAIPDRRPGNLSVSTAKDGTFSFDPQIDKFALLVFAKEGFARVSQAELERKTRIELTPWATVTGVVMKGKRPWAGAQVSLNFDQHNGGGQPHMYFDYDTVADKKGRFTFRRVPPDMQAPTIGRRIMLRKRGSITSWGSSHTAPVTLEAGKTTEVVIGGTGQPVIGRFDIKGVDPKKVTWNSGFCYLRPIRPPAVVPGMKRPFRTSYSIKIQPDGSFRIEDIPPGNYELIATVYEEKLNNRGFPDRGKKLGSARMRFTIAPIPGGITDKPLDLGTMKLE